MVTIINKMKIINEAGPAVIVPELATTTKKEVLRELAAAAADQYPQLDIDQLCAILEERENLGSTGIGEGVAIPHGKIPGLDGLATVFGRSTNGIPFAAPDGRPIHLFFLLLAPVENSARYLAALAEVARFFRDHQVRAQLLQAESGEELTAILRGNGGIGHE